MNLKDKMANELPKIMYKGEECTVDFRLGELRCVVKKENSMQGLKPGKIKKVYPNGKFEWDKRYGDTIVEPIMNTIKFTELTEDKNSPIKKELRVLRFRTSNMDYIRGLDD